MAQAKWLFMDSEKDVGVGSAVVPNTVTLAQVTTFANALEAFTDGVLYKNQLVAENLPAYTIPESGVEVERRGTIIIQHVLADGTKNNYRIAIPAISQGCVAKMGKNRAKVTDACEALVLAAFATMTGFSAGSLAVVNSVVTESQR